MNKILHEKVDADFDNLVQDLRGCIALRSVLDESKCTQEHPFGAKLTEALDYFLASASKMGFRTKNIDNMVGYAEMGEGPKLVGVLAHLDVVPEGELAAWTYPPYAAEIHDGIIYGRGVVDDKGPAFAALHAMKALRDSGVKLGCRVRVIVGIDEETGSRCMVRYNKTEETPTLSFSPDANFPLINAEKGRLYSNFEREFAAGGAGPALVSMKGGTRPNVVPDKAEAVFEGEFAPADEKALAAAQGVTVTRADGKTTVAARGIAAHAMNPEKGDNAIIKLFAALGKAKWQPQGAPEYAAEVAKSFADTRCTGLGLARTDEVSGPLTCNLAILNYADGKLTLSTDMRYPVTLSGDDLIRDYEKALKALGAKLTVNAHGKPLYVDAASPLIKKLLEAYKNITGIEDQPRSTGGGTYCRNFPNAVSFGPNFPGDVDLDHQPDERVSLDLYRKTFHLYAEALDLLVK